MSTNNKVDNALRLAGEILESIRGTVEMGGRVITIQDATYEQIVATLNAIRAIKSDE